MERKLLLLPNVVALAGFLAGGMLWLGQAPAHGTSEPDKPIMLMTPSDLFPDPKLRELAEAAQHGDIKKIDALIAQGVNVNGKGKYGITPLYAALQVQNKSGYKAILDHGADPNNIWTTGHTLMNMIAETPDPYFLKLALEHGGNPNLVAPRLSETPLFHAVGYDSKVNLPLLIKAGADLNHQDSDGETPLMKAAMLNQYDAVYTLLEAGADYRIKDNFGTTVASEIESSAKYMDTSGQDGVWLRKVVAFLKTKQFLPPDLTVRHMAPVSATQMARRALEESRALSNQNTYDRLGCVSADQLTNKDTPLDLDFAWMKCLMNDQYDRAVAIFSLSIAYANFDTLRVADKTAHGVNSEVFGMVASGVPQAKLKKFDSVKYKTLNDPARFGAICTRIAEIGPPGYYPEYMVGHGMQMFTGMQTAQGLVPGFDAAKAWTETLKDNLHCSNVAASKIPSGASAPTSRSASTADGSQATDPLAPTNDIGCVAADQLNNNDTPPDLFAAIVKCVKTNDYDKAVFMLMMAGVYADFDMRRVPDPTTHNVDMVLLNRSKKTMSEAEIKTLGKDLAATADTPAKLAAVCEQLERTGPPDYYPRYMVQFGMDAATGLKTPNGLATDFDPKQAWHDALTQYLNCTNVPASAATTPN